MHRHEGNAMEYRQDIALPTCSLQLGERAYSTTGR